MLRQLNTPEETLTRIQEIERTFFDNKSKIKDLLGHSLYCCCSGVPNIEVSYDLGGARKIEYYCNSCKSSLVEREREPTDRKVLAEKYECVAVDELPKTSPTE